MSYHKFNNLAVLLNGDLAAKIGRVISSIDLMDRCCNCSLPSKVNSECVYEGKSWGKCLIFEVKCSLCEAIYIGNTQQTSKKRMKDDQKGVPKGRVMGLVDSKAIKSTQIMVIFWL